MATLIESLAFSGSRKADGSVNAAGRAWFFDVGSQSAQATVYEDEDGTVPAAQPVVLDSAGKADVFTDGPVACRIEDSTGNLVSYNAVFNYKAATEVVVENAGQTGTLPSGSQGAGGRIYLDDVVTRLGLSLGGLDCKYLESSGATSRYVKDKLAELSVSVKDFAAKGDGLADDTLAIQAAINRVAALGGGIVYFPPGVYKISTPLTCSTGGVRLEGAGCASTSLKNYNAIAGSVSFSNANGASVRGLKFDENAPTTGTALAFSSCNDIDVSGCSFSGHQYQIDGNNCLRGVVSGCYFAGKAGTTANLYVRGTSSSWSVSSAAAANVNAAFASLSGAGYHSFSGVISASGITLASTCTGPTNVIGCPNLTATAGSSQVIVDSYDTFITTLSANAGDAVTPSTTGGAHIFAISGNSSGAIAVNAPSLFAPGVFFPFFIILFRNVSGPITWNLDAAYHLGAGGAIDGTDNKAVAVGFVAFGARLYEAFRTVSTLI